MMKTILAMGLAFVLAGVGSASAKSLLEGGSMEMAKERAQSRVADGAKE
mgnify:CR=1 FL=1